MSNDEIELKDLIREIFANQQSLHDDMSAVVDRLTKLEEAVNILTQYSNQPAAIDEHELYTAARSLVVETGRASTSMLQRVLRIGYSRAASLMDKLEENNIIGPQNGSTPREVFLDRDSLSEIEEEEENDPVSTDDTDDLYEEAVRAVIEGKMASTSYLQRQFRIGYSRAARLMDLLEETGVIGSSDGSRPREVLVNE